MISCCHIGRRKAAAPPGDPPAPSPAEILRRRAEVHLARAGRWLEIGDRESRRRARHDKQLAGELLLAARLAEERPEHWEEFA